MGVSKVTTKPRTAIPSTGLAQAFWKGEVSIQKHARGLCLQSGSVCHAAPVDSSLGVWRLCGAGHRRVLTDSTVTASLLPTFMCIALLTFVGRHR
eukprot:4183593-Amphidinium_carterae.1